MSLTLSLPLLTRKTAVVLAALLLVTSCRGKHHRDTVKNEEPGEVAPRIASTFKMSDPAASTQLLHGFYGLESGAWRWTAGSFTVLLRPPLASAQRGAVLTLSFNIPDIVIEKVKTVTISASLGTANLKTQSFSKAGAYTFTTDIAPELLAKEAVTVDFKLNKSIPAGAVDQRELGVIATAVSLESK